MSHKKHKNIGFDLDDVLLNFSDALREHMNRKYEMNVQRYELKTFYIEEFFGISPEETRRAIDVFFFHDDHAKSMPMEGAREVVEELSKDNKLFIVTAKPNTLEQQTIGWLDKHYPGIFEQVHFANFFGTGIERRKKSDICRELNLDIFIDDSLDNAIDVAGAGIPVLLFDSPWNQIENLPPLVLRVYSWSDILKALTS